MTHDPRIEDPNQHAEPTRVSVVVAEAGTHWNKWNDAWSDKNGTPPVLLVQQEQETGVAFAERVATSVARLGRQRAVLERLALVVRDDFSPAARGTRSEVLSTVALHLVRSQTPLTIRFADAQDELPAEAG